MSYQSSIENALDAHDADKRRIEFGAPELNAGGHFGSQLVRGHIGLMPAIGGDNAVIPLRGQIDDAQQGGLLIISTPSYIRHASAPLLGI